MPVRKNPSLNDILATFRDTLTKTAEGMPPVPPEAMGGMPPEAMAGAMPSEAMPPEAMPGMAPGDPSAMGEQAMPQQVTDQDVAAAAQALDAASYKAEQADAEVANAKETLQEVAEEFINEHDAALSKEAQVYGQLFAASCIEEMNKHAMLNDVSNEAYLNTMEALQGNNSNMYGINETEALQKCAAEAYDVTMQAIADASNYANVEDNEHDLLQKCASDAYDVTMQALQGNDDTLEKQAAIYDAAYSEVMAKLAGFEGADELNEVAGQELSPEEVAAVYAASQGDDDISLDDLSEDELAELAAQIDAEEAGEEEGNLLDDLSDEELNSLADQIAEEQAVRADEGVAEDAEPASPEAIANAANLLAAARDGEDGELKVASQIYNDAYNKTLEALRR